MSNTDLPSLPATPAGASDVRAPAFPLATGSASVKCTNCGAELPREKAGTGPRGEIICCAGCMFNPLGCRCKYGELGVLETFVPDFDEDDSDGDLDDDGEDFDCGIVCDRAGNPEGCTNAGSEQCDFECPNRNWLYESLAKAAKRGPNTAISNAVSDTQRQDRP